MKREESKCRALGLLIGALLGLCCGSAQAEWVKFAPAVEAGESSNTVNFGGHQWIIVGTEDSPITFDNNVFNYPYTASNGGGIKSETGTITLLLKDGDIGFDNVYFKENSPWRSNYNGSDLQGAMEDISDYFEEHNEKEWKAIAERTLTAEGAPVPSYMQLSGGDVEDQKFWALSIVEWAQLTSQDARAYLKDGETDNGWSSAWWLRSPDDGLGAIVGLPGGAD